MPQIDHIEVGNGTYPLFDKSNIFIITKPHPDDSSTDEQYDYVLEYDKDLLDILEKAWLEGSRIKVNRNTITSNRHIVDKSTRNTTSPTVSINHLFSGIADITIYGIVKYKFNTNNVTK